jgi:hypothetical protein
MVVHRQRVTREQLVGRFRRLHLDAEPTIAEDVAGDLGRGPRETPDA